MSRSVIIPASPGRSMVDRIQLADDKWGYCCVPVIAYQIGLDDDESIVYTFAICETDTGDASGDMSHAAVEDCDSEFGCAMAHATEARDERHARELMRAAKTDTEESP